MLMLVNIGRDLRPACTVFDQRLHTEEDCCAKTNLIQASPQAAVIPSGTTATLLSRSPRRFSGVGYARKRWHASPSSDRDLTRLVIVRQSVDDEVFHAEVRDGTVKSVRAPAP